MNDIATRGATPTRRALFLAFLGLGLTAFGGGLPLARHMVVTRHNWLSEEELLELQGLCQLLPGGTFINLTLAVGMRCRGPSGALAALLGLIGAPLLAIVLLGALYAQYKHSPWTGHLLAGLAAAIAGLLLASALRFVCMLSDHAASAVVALMCFAGIALLRLPLAPTLLIMTPLGILVAAGRQP